DLVSFTKANQFARQEANADKYIESQDDISVDTNNNFRMLNRGLAGKIQLHKILGYAAITGKT
ncbi:DhaKLM operon coactivator DhaQ, partial [Streptococcus suis]